MQYTSAVGVASWEESAHRTPLDERRLVLEAKGCTNFSFWLRADEGEWEPHDQTTSLEMAFDRWRTGADKARGMLEQVAYNASGPLDEDDS